MALSGTFKSSEDNGANQSLDPSNPRWCSFFYVNWTATQNVANNSSTISWKCYAGSNYSNTTSTVYAGPITVKINGTTVLHKTDRFVISKNDLIGSGSLTVAHAADGTKSCSVSISGAIYNYAENCKYSGTITLNTIPRATTPTLSSSSVNMGSRVTINLPRASSSFTHDLAYSFAGSIYVAIKTGVATSYTWTTPDLASKIPNATSGTATIRCITKNGGTTVGTKTITMTLKVPTTVVPTISSVTATEATAGLAEQFGAFIKTKSKISVAITAAGAKGSTIKSYSTTLDGKSYTGGGFTSSAITAAGTVSMVTTVTDTRGRTASKTTNLTVLDYTPPSISALQVYRVNISGSEDANGEYLAARYAYSVAPLGGKNTADMALEYKRTAASDWSDLMASSDLSADTTAYPKTATLSSDYQYDIRMTVKDYFGASDIHLAVLPSGEVILDIGADGKSLSVGRVAERPGVFEVSYKTRLTGGLETITLQEKTDFNTLTSPGFYGGQNDDSGHLNCPVSSGAFTLEVFPGGDAGQVLQRLTTTDKTAPKIYERFYTYSAWGAWLCVSDFKSKILWSGGRQMTETEQAVLSEPVSSQPNGIVLMFSWYTGTATDDSNFRCAFIPKIAVATFPGKGYSFTFFHSVFSHACGKYLYIHDDKIVGYSGNDSSGTGSTGITFNNKKWVLRYVFGV